MPASVHGLANLLNANFCPATEGGGFPARLSRFSQTVIPDALQHEVVLRRAGMHAPLDPRHKAEGDIEEKLHTTTASLLPPAAAQDFASSKIASA